MQKKGLITTIRNCNGKNCLRRTNSRCSFKLNKVKDDMKKRLLSKQKLTPTHEQSLGVKSTINDAVLNGALKRIRENRQMNLWQA